MLKRGSPIDIICVGVICLGVAAFCYPYFFYSLESNFREIQSYNMDTPMLAAATQAAVAAPWFRVPMNDYGHLYFNLAILIAYPYSLFFPLTVRATVSILRIVSLLGGCATITLIYVFAKRYLGRTVAMFAALVVGSSPAFLYYCETIKPDSCQAFFLLLSLYMLSRALEASDLRQTGPRRMRADAGFVFAAAAAAGAAFGSKFQGIFLLPLLAVAASVIPLDRVKARFFGIAERALIILSLPLALGLAKLGLTHHEDIIAFLFLTNEVQPHAKLFMFLKLFRIACFLASPVFLVLAGTYALNLDLGWLRTRLVRRTMLLLATGLAFFIGFAIVSPWMLPHLKFVREIYLRTDTAGAGDRFGFRWLSLLFGYYDPNFMYIGYGTGVLSIVGAGVLLVAAARRDYRGARLPLLFVLAFAVIFAAMLIGGVNMIVIQYGLPMVAPLALLAAFGLCEICCAFASQLAARPAFLASTVLTAALMVAQVWQGASNVLRYPDLFTALTPQNRLLGEWLSRCVPREAHILTAPYSYVPPDFAHVVVDEGYGALVRSDPDLVVISVSRTATATADEKNRMNQPGYMPSDLARFYGALYGSGAWSAASLSGAYHVYSRAGFFLRGECR